MLIKLELYCSKLHTDACTFSNWLQADENIILKETLCNNCVNEFPANGVDKSVADPAGCGPYV